MSRVSEIMSQVAEGYLVRFQRDSIRSMTWESELSLDSEGYSLRKIHMDQDGNIESDVTDRCGAVYATQYVTDNEAYIVEVHKP